MTPGDCDDVREVVAELALGIADGEERAVALEHLTGCAECRARVERLSSVADELLLMAPAIEPPPGFESRVASAIEPATAPPRRPWGARFGIPAIAALAAAACAAVVVWLATSDDRSLADSYRDTLAVAHGEYFEAAPLQLPGGKWAGYVYGYQGTVSWVLAIASGDIPPGKYQIELVTHDGDRLPLVPLKVEEGGGSAGAATPVDYEDLAQLRLLDAHGREVADSDLHE